MKNNFSIVEWYMHKMTFSTKCFIISLFLGVSSMGLQGQLICWLVSPVLKLRFPPMKSWTGDWVWPALIYVSVLWPFGFLLAGWVNRHMNEFDWPRAVVCGAYLGILLLWGWFLWFVTLTLLPKPNFRSKMKQGY